MIARTKDLWMRFALLLAGINSAILLIILFFCVITPLGLLMRCIGRSPFASNGRSDTHWIPVPADHDPRKPF